MNRIKITAQETLKGNIKVLNIDCDLWKFELPDLYLKSYPHCYWNIFTPGIHISIKPAVFTSIIVDGIYTKEDFEQLISLLKQCGKNLSECRKQKQPFVVEI